MSKPVTIALDAMGGDDAPQIVVAGANIARQRYPEARYLLFGDRDAIEPRLKRFRKLANAVEIQHTTEAVQPDDKPSQVIRGGRKTSMHLAIEAVKSGAAGGVVSAGNTGALMAIAMLVLRRLPGIDRPGIASFFPTMRGESLMLDLGANVSCDARNLVQFAAMGAVFSRTVLGIDQPTIGLLNVGSEETKGNEVLKNAAAMLRASKLDGTFHGYVEGDDIAAGTTDVVVTDGFSGNIALKSAEGTARLVTHFFREAFKASPAAQIGYVFAKRALDKLRIRTDPRRYNGAVLLGLNGICVKSHGGTDALGFATAIGLAIDMIRHDFNDRIAAQLGNLADGRLKAAEVG